jgi:UDP-N-acetyl-D-galactosamine dehydrogenase
MGAYVASEVVKLLINSNNCVKGARTLVLGITFKENCPDIRNSKVIDIIRELQEYGCEIDIADPWASAAEVEHEYGLAITTDTASIGQAAYHAVVAAVGHKEFVELDPRQWLVEDGVIYDVKGIYERNIINARL